MRLRTWLPVCLLALALVASAPASSASADDVTEAAELFESGNEHFERGMRARGDRRTRELEAALDDYFASLRFVRSRNVLYNTALVLEQLERWEDAFNYWTEYLAVTGLSAAETADGTTHRDAVRPRVSVLSAESEPPGAEVWIDRRDLAARGHTPAEIALPAGEHTIYFVREGWVEASVTVTTALGTTTPARVTMTPEPVAVQVLAPDAAITLDGVAITAGASALVAPGWHVLRLELDGRPAIERRFEVPAGSAPIVIDLTTAAAAIVTAPSGDEATLSVSAPSDARVSVDGFPRATGAEVEFALPAGEHEIEVVPAGLPAARARRRFAAGERVHLRVEAHGTSGDLVAARGITGVTATLGLLGSIGLSVAAGLAHDDYRNGPTEGGFSSVETLNLAADVAWGVTAVVGVLSLVFVGVDDGGSSATFEDPDFAAAATLEEGAE